MSYVPGSYEPRREPLGPPAATPPLMPSGPPQQYAPPSQRPPQRRKGMPGWATALIIIGGVIALIVGGGIVLVAIGAGSTVKPKVTVVSCGSDGFATTMTYILVNNDKVAHDYYVEGTVGHSPTTPDVLKNVGPGERASGSMMSPATGDCAITKVDQQ